MNETGARWCVELGAGQGEVNPSSIHIVGAWGRSAPSLSPSASHCPACRWDTMFDATFCHSMVPARVPLLGATSFAWAGGDRCPPPQGSPLPS